MTTGRTLAGNYAKPHAAAPALVHAFAAFGRGPGDTRKVSVAWLRANGVPIDHADAPDAEAMDMGAGETREVDLGKVAVGKSRLTRGRIAQASATMGGNPRADGEGVSPITVAERADKPGHYVVVREHGEHRIAALKANGHAKPVPVRVVKPKSNDAILGKAEDAKAKWISEKIAKLIGEGKSQEQAAAIAYAMYENLGKADDEGTWVTMNGRPVLIRDGETPAQALHRVTGGAAGSTGGSKPVDHKAAAKAFAKANAQTFKSGSAAEVKAAQAKFLAAQGFTDKEIATYATQEKQWYSSVYTEGGQVMRQVAAKEMGRDFKADDFHDSKPVLDRQPTDRERGMVNAVRAFTTEGLREKYGDSVTVYRGVADSQAEALLGGEGDHVDMGLNSLSSWSLEKDTAENYALFGKTNKGALVSVKVPVENVWLADFKEGRNEVVIGAKSQRVRVPRSAVSARLRKAASVGEFSYPTGAMGAMVVLDNDPESANWLNRKRAMGKTMTTATPGATVPEETAGASPAIETTLTDAIKRRINALATAVADLGDASDAHVRKAARVVMRERARARRMGTIPGPYKRALDAAQAAVSRELDARGWPGLPLGKGDVEGHEFHGNQYSSGATMVEAGALGSPTAGRMSGTSRAAALERLRVSLFGPKGLESPTVQQPTEVESLLRQAKELRDLAARGMKPRAYGKKADELEAKAIVLSGIEETKKFDPSQPRAADGKFGEGGGSSKPRGRIGRIGAKAAGAIKRVARGAKLQAADTAHALRTGIRALKGESISAEDKSRAVTALKDAGKALVSAGIFAAPGGGLALAVIEKVANKLGGSVIPSHFRKAADAPAKLPSLAGVEDADLAAMCEGIIEALGALDKHSEGTPMTTTVNTIRDLVAQELFLAKGGFPLAPRDTAWDSAAAVKRWREHTGSTEAPSAGYAKGFLQVTGDGKAFGDYGYPFVDVIDGKAYAVPKALFAARAAASGGRGAAVNHAVQSKVDEYQKALDAQAAPAKKATMESRVADVKAMLADAGMDASDLADECDMSEEDAAAILDGKKQPTEDEMSAMEDACAELCKADPTSTGDAILGADPEPEDGTVEAESEDLGPSDYEIRDAINDALRAKYKAGYYVCGIYPSTGYVIFRYCAPYAPGMDASPNEGKCYRAPYDEDADGKFVIGDAVEVERKVVFEPVAKNADGTVTYRGARVADDAYSIPTPHGEEVALAKSIREVMGRDAVSVNSVPGAVLVTLAKGAGKDAPALVVHANVSVVDAPAPARDFPLVPIGDAEYLAKSAEKGIVYLMVYQPPADEANVVKEDLDSQGEWASAADIETAAHDFMLKGGQINIMHKGRVTDDKVVENAVTQGAWTVGNRTLRKGTWYIGVKLTKASHEAFKRGELRGASMEGLKTVVA